MHRLAVPSPSPSAGLLDGPEVGLVVGTHEGLLLLTALPGCGSPAPAFSRSSCRTFSGRWPADRSGTAWSLLVAIEGSPRRAQLQLHVGGDVAGPGRVVLAAGGGCTGPGGAAGAEAQVGQAEVVRHGAGGSRALSPLLSLVPFLCCKPGLLRSLYSVSGGCSSYAWHYPLCPLYQFFHVI